MTSSTAFSSQDAAIASSWPDPSSVFGRIWRIG
jgi:hypothetical protein